ncbi:MAG: metallophosphoesterase [Acetobacteraceae bacterium]|nr:metallophosphoesterase [Acetobacteraceae bacterium]
MRWAIVGDIHGNLDYLGAVMADVRRRRPDQVVFLGDLFEVKVPKGAAGRFVFRGIEQVVDVEPALLEVLARARVLRGNQEERVLRLVPRNRLPGALLPLRRLPRRLVLRGGVVLAHGHRLEWLNPWGHVFHPRLWGWPPRVLILGHNHQNAMFRLARLPRAPWTFRPEPLPLRFGAAVALDRGARYVINVADVRRPSWLMYDDAAATVVFYDCAGGGLP